VFRERGAWVAIGAQGLIREFDGDGRVSVTGDPVSRFPSGVGRVVLQVALGRDASDSLQEKLGISNPVRDLDGRVEATDFAEGVGLADLLPATRHRVIRARGSLFGHAAVPARSRRRRLRGGEVSRRAVALRLAPRYSNVPCRLRTRRRRARGLGCSSPKRRAARRWPRAIRRHASSSRCRHGLSAKGSGLRRGGQGGQGGPEANEIDREYETCRYSSVASVPKFLCRERSETRISVV